MLELIGSNIGSILQSTIRLAAPFILAAVGGLFSDMAGVSSIELEAVLLMGAFAGFVGAFFSGSLLLGMLLAMAAGVVICAIYSYLVVGIGARAALVATALVLFATGFSSFFNRALFGVSTDVVSITALPDLRIPFLSDIPFLGPILFQQNLLVYLAFLLVAAQFFFFKRTMIGLEWRSVGENANAADTAGLPVRRYRHIAALLTGAIAGLAGAYLSIASSNVFVEKMSAEKGYAAFAIIILGKYTPVGAMLGCLLYGFADALQLSLQAMGVEVPNQFLLMLPYVFTLVVMCLSGRGNAPEGHGKYFAKK
ncbi:ABC transporter permease [Pseudoflavonifractor sp. HCP28S3_F10]|uniref:ABC transporter permease n=1 Tax=Pseudoflavonifractor sp. HCP28S3_F10 TaxID=3438947 RepID=UPI003F8A9CFB